MVKEYGSSFSVKNLRRMVQFAVSFPDEHIVVSLVRQLSWTHFIALIPLKDPLQRTYARCVSRNNGEGQGDAALQAAGTGAPGGHAGESVPPQLRLLQSKRSIRTRPCLPRPMIVSVGFPPAIPALTVIRLGPCRAWNFPPVACCHRRCRVRNNPDSPRADVGGDGQVLNTASQIISYRGRLMAFGIRETRLHPVSSPATINSTSCPLPLFFSP